MVAKSTANMAELSGKTLFIPTSIMSCGLILTFDFCCALNFPSNDLKSILV